MAGPSHAAALTSAICCSAPAVPGGPTDGEKLNPYDHSRNSEGAGGFGENLLEQPGRFHLVMTETVLPETEPNA